MNIIEKLTNQMKELLEKAHSLAFYQKNAELNPLHFLYSLAINENSILRQVLNQLNLESSLVEEKIKNEIDKLPKVDSLAKENISLSKEAINSLNLADALATKNGDSYISVDT
jgi:ATP-dependent Clp protease ATP-binding subunit ClpA